MPIQGLLSEIKKIQWLLFKKADVGAFIAEQAKLLGDDQAQAVFDDLYAFNAYLGRIEGYPTLAKVPFWEYSVCLEWCDTHMMIGEAFDLSLDNAKRFLGNIKKYFDYLSTKGSPTDSAEIDKAIKKICGGKKLRLVTDIPFTGEEIYTILQKDGESYQFDMTDYWLLILKTTHYDDKWIKVLEAAMKVSKERVTKVKELQARMAKAGFDGLENIVYNDVTRADVDKAIAWFSKAKDSFNAKKMPPRPFLPPWKKNSKAFSVASWLNQRLLACLAPARLSDSLLFPVSPC